MPARIKRGDTVVVLSGRDRGKRGQVRQVLPKKERLVVEGVNIIKKHQRARQAGQQSEIVEREAPIQASNVAIFNPASSRADRVGFKVEGGSKVRIFKSSGEAIDA